VTAEELEGDDMTTTESSTTLGPLLSAMSAAAGTARGREIVGGHDEDYEVSVQGEPGILIRMRGGDLSVHDVSEGEPAFCTYTRVEFEPQTISAIAAGATTPAEAANSGGMLMRSRLYGGGQFMTLLRLAQKLDLFAA
jgi:hypothetical protein